MDTEQDTFAGIDGSLTGTGIAIINTADEKIAIKTIKTGPKDFANDLDRIQHITDTILSSIPSNTKMVCIEDVFISKFQVGSGMKLIGLAFLIRNALYKAKIPFFLVAPTQLKKFISNKGNSSKDQITKEVYKKYGCDCSDDNQADAVVLSKISQSLYAYLHKKDLNVLRPQMEVIKAVAHERPAYNVDRSGLKVESVKEEENA
jgi:Holliday junction resolvasome RuvABC endonuclease subunit